MRVLLTGIAGFAGSHVLEHILQNTDWDVVGIASWKHKGTPERVEEVLSGNLEWTRRVEIITHDLESPFPERTKKRIGQCDYILNLASNSHVDRSITDPVPFITNNVNLVLTMLEFAREYKPKLFVQFSTDEVYGPAPEGDNFKEWSTIIPSNPYSASKAAQEAIAISYWRTYGVPVVITNTMNLYGQMQDPEKYIARIISSAENGSTVTVHGTPEKQGSRFYLHARNMADALLFIMKKEPSLYPNADRPDRYNIVGDDEVNNLEMLNTVSEIMRRRIPYVFEDFHKTRAGHDRRYALDGTKLKDMGWKAPLGFRESMERYINWTLEHKLWL